MARAERKARFLSLLQYEEIPGTLFIRLLDNFIVYSAIIGRTITVPKGFTCDGESVFFKSSTEAGVIHDYLYRKDSDPIVSRRIADDVFCEMSILDRCWWITSKAKWLAVRIFAWKFYHEMNVLDEPKG